jgi:hypothetical protein
MHRNSSGFRPLLLVSLLTFCFGQHLMYDILVVIIYWMLQYESKKEPYIACLLAASLCLPLSIAAGQIPTIHFVIPLLLLVYTIEALYSDYRFSKNNVTKNAS